MQSSLYVSPGNAPATPSGRARIVSAVAFVTFVALVHVALIATIMRITDQSPQLRGIASPVLTAQLLSQEPAPAAAAAVPAPLRPAVQSAPRPVPRKKVEPHAAPRRVTAPPAHLPTPAPTAAPSEAATPTTSAPNAAAAHETADTQSASATAPNGPQVPAAAPASGRETLAISAPKSVRHLDCQIVKPDYPALSRRRGETGTADVRFIMGPTGAIESVELAKSSGYSRLDDAALAAMRASSCRPYVENGTPMRVAYVQPFGFSLDD